jgi:hypothetical protein
MADARLRDFHLVGGTALALVLGHRQSIDIDLFSPRDFDVEALRTHLVNSHAYAVDKVSRATLIGHADGIKVDCIRYNYPLDFRKIMVGLCPKPSNFAAAPCRSFTGF